MIRLLVDLAATVLVEAGTRAAHLARRLDEHLATASRPADVELRRFLDRPGPIAVYPCCPHTCPADCTDVHRTPCYFPHEETS